MVCKLFSKGHTREILFVQKSFEKWIPFLLSEILPQSTILTEYFDLILVKY